MFDELKIFLLIFLRVGSKIRIHLLMQFAMLILFPIDQLEVILGLVAKQSHNF